MCDLSQLMLYGESHEHFKGKGCSPLKLLKQPSSDYSSSNIMKDIGLTHIALPVADIHRSIEFYATYAQMQVVHKRLDGASGIPVVWLSDGIRPFVIVLIQKEVVHPVLSPLAHLGVGCSSREELDQLCDQAKQKGILLDGPQDAGYPVGYWAFLQDPDGHTLELSYGQEVGLTVKEAIQQA